MNVIRVHISILQSTEAETAYNGCMKKKSLNLIISKLANLVTNCAIVDVLIAKSAAIN